MKGKHNEIPIISMRACRTPLLPLPPRDENTRQAAGVSFYVVALVGRDWHQVIGWICDSRLTNFALQNEVA